MMVMVHGLFGYQMMKKTSQLLSHNQRKRNLEIRNISNLAIIDAKFSKKLFVIVYFWL